MVDHVRSQTRSQHSRTLRAALGLTAGAGVLLAAAGCGSGGTGSAQTPLTQASQTVQPKGVSTTAVAPPTTATATSTVTNTVTSSPSPSTGPTGPTSPSSAATTPSGTANGVAECNVNGLHLTMTRSGAAMNHQYVSLVLTNIGARSCRTGGFGGVSMVGFGNGTQIGAAAVRQGDSYGRFTLAPGAKMTSQLSIANVGVYDSGHCAPVKVDGLRVYPPNSTKALYVALPTTGCKNVAVQLMQQQAFRVS